MSQFSPIRYPISESDCAQPSAIPPAHTYPSSATAQLTRCDAPRDAPRRIHFGYFISVSSKPIVGNCCAKASTSERSASIAGQLCALSAPLKSASFLPMPEPLISCVCARARACVPARACVRDGRAADFLGDADAAVDELGDGVEVRLLEAARGERGRAWRVGAGGRLGG